MKLVKIYFDAYKSLLNKELSINHSCIGFVGTNESGKSNVLAAFNILGGEKKLLASDTPKMDKMSFPKIRYELLLDPLEHQELQNEINEWVKLNTIDCDNDIKLNNNSIFYTVQFNKELKEEERFFSLSRNISVGKEILILLHSKFQHYDFVNYKYDLKNGAEYSDITNAIAISKKILAENEKNQSGSFEYERIKKEIETIDKELEKIKAQINLLNEQVSNGLPDEMSKNTTLKKIEDYVVAGNKFELDKKKLADLLSKANDGYDVFSVAECIQDVEADISSAKKNVDDEKRKLIELNKKITQLNKLPIRTAEQKIELETCNKDVKISSELIKKLESELNQYSKDLPFYKETLGAKYTTNISEINRYIESDFASFLTKLIPKVVFWEYSGNYILQSETNFSEILEKNSLQDISRPLVNLFRIGLEIKGIDDLKQKISEIKHESNERSRINKILNIKVNEFIRKVWEDYDQNIHITLEKDQIRIEIFDPNNDVNSSYYNMTERSQGCQTFLSFLMTIGAEAEHNVINNIILLLDEPETHLHPSGVRFMLQELIKISEGNNLVIYATHSIFLIDKNNLDRHIILKKEKEHTLINPANIGRIGYFMQEEVLYNTLDLNLGRDFSNASNFNFVFEGDGDAYIFSHYFEKILKEETRPYKLRTTSFHQGGKCSDIQKYFMQRPIQLGTKWIFILDRDKPADDLKKFIEGKYKDYLNTDIHIFQYDYPSCGHEVVLEDMLGEQIIADTYKEVFELLSSKIDSAAIIEAIAEKKEFNIYHAYLLDKIQDKNKRDICKGKFKELLNSKLRKDLSEKKHTETFEKFLPIYSKWIDNVISGLMPRKTRV